MDTIAIAIAIAIVIAITYANRCAAAACDGRKFEKREREVVDEAGETEELDYGMGV